MQYARKIAPEHGLFKRGGIDRAALAGSV